MKKFNNEIYKTQIRMNDKHLAKKQKLLILQKDSLSSKVVYHQKLLPQKPVTKTKDCINRKSYNISCISVICRTCLFVLFPIMHFFLVIIGKEVSTWYCKLLKLYYHILTHNEQYQLFFLSFVYKKKICTLAYT